MDRVCFPRKLKTNNLAAAALMYTTPVFLFPLTSWCDACREEAAEELHSGDDRQAEPSVRTVSVSPVLPACPAGGAVRPTVLLPD